MIRSYFFVIVALLSFTAMGIIHKMGDRRQADPLAIALHAMISAGVFSACFALLSRSSILRQTPVQVLLIALPFGASAAIGLWFFQKGLRYGHIATSWLMVNLSAGIPTALSILVYHEHPGRKKALALLLVIMSLLLMWRDQRGRQPTTTWSSTEIV
jgi:drug/metabolite transporter (DMT)-like permease